MLGAWQWILVTDELYATLDKSARCDKPPKAGPDPGIDGEFLNFTKVG